MKPTAPQGGALSAFIVAFCLLASVNHVGAQTLPFPWTNSDVGSPAVAGRARVASGLFTVDGAGAAGGTRDELHLVWLQITGDVEVIARVNNLETIDAGTKAGIMIRAGLAGRARHAFMSVSA